LGWRKRREVWRTLDEWLRHRLRAIQLKHWRRGSTIYRELTHLGAAEPRRQAGGAEFPLLVAEQRW
jgi:hypothetical protein